MRANGRGRNLRVLNYLGVVLVCLWLLLPFYWLAATSFMRLPDLASVPPQYIPLSPTLSNYFQIIVGGTFFEKGLSQGSVEIRSILPTLANSIIVGLGLVAYTLLLACPAGYAYSRYRFPGSNLTFFMLLTLRAVPLMAMVIPFFIIFRILNLINTYLGLILAQSVLTIPFAVWIFRDYVDAIPRDMEEAALIDGASRLGAFYRVLLPLSRPGITAIAVFCFITSWGEFLFALILTNGLTLPPVLAGFQASNQVAWTQLAAASCFAMIPPIALILLFQKYLVRGLAGGALKA